MKTPPHVWIVDDDADDQYLLEVAFKTIMPPVQVKQLFDGEELFVHLEQTPQLPKLILLDLNMPRKDGFQTLQELRSINDYKTLPVVVLTTSDREEDRKKSLALGANGFLTKPPSQEEVKAMLQQLALDWRLT